VDEGGGDKMKKINMLVSQSIKEAHQKRMIKENEEKLMIT